MQQTENYKLNLIETDDVFSPIPLNENAEKTEAALTTVLADAQAINAELVNRMTALEARRIYTGLYTGTSGEQDILLGETPVAVIVHNSSTTAGEGIALAVTGSSAVQVANGSYVKIIDGGFQAWSGFNTANKKYHYIAIVQ